LKSISKDSESPQKTGVLRGITVVELSEFIAGPYCAKLLADMGAEVIKLESPGQGDITRRRPPFKGDSPGPDNSGLFFFLNANKLSITLDPFHPAGKKAFFELIAKADLLIEDRSPVVMEEAELDFKHLAKVNPRLVVTSITPFGQTGPYRNYRAYPLNTFQSGGEGYLTPGASLYPQRPPLKWANFSGDYFCGVSAAGAALLALFHQRATGKGQHVDISKQEALLDMNTIDLLRWPNRGELANRATRGYKFAGVMPCKNGYVDFGFHRWPDEWQAILSVIGTPGWWGEDENLKDRAYCEEHGNELKQRLADSFKVHTKEEIYQKAIAKHAAIAPCLQIDEVADSPQMNSRGFFAEIDHPNWGKFKFPTAPYRFSEAPWRLRHLAPSLGEHNEEIYKQRLSMSTQELNNLKAKGAI